MIRPILTLILMLCILNVFSQKQLLKGFVVLETGDTISGTLKDKNYYSASGVRLHQGVDKIRYSKRKLSEIHLGAEMYVKSDLDIWFKRFFRKEAAGNVNLYTFRNSKRLGGFDTDINSGRLIPAIRFYCSDYPILRDTIQYTNKRNIGKFIERYNIWKLANPDSKSFFEEKIHNKPPLNFKISFLLPGAGFEFGISDKISLSAMLKNEFGYGQSVGWILNPFFDTQLRYYHNIDKRRAENKRTYKYSGNYICLLNVYAPSHKFNLTGVEYGWQRMVNKHWYYNVGLGAGISASGIQHISILYDIDFGYNF